MITIQGKGVSKGIAKGPIYFFQRPNTTVVKTVVADIEAEKARLAEAQAASIAQINDLAEKCREDACQEMARSSSRPMPCLWKMRILWSASSP